MIVRQYRWLPMQLLLLLQLGRGSIACAQSPSQESRREVAQVTQPAAGHPSSQLELDWRRWEFERRIAAERLEIDRQRAVADQNFFAKHFPTLVTGLLSLAAILISITQVWVAHIGKGRELDLARINKEAEIQSASLKHERDWNLEAVKFVASNSDLIFGVNAETRDRVKNVMLVTFPPAITAALFERLEIAAETELEKLAWQGGREAAAKLLLVRTDGLYVTDETNYTMYLRFYSDGTVVSASVSGKGPDQAKLVSTWLQPGEKSKFPEGKVVLTETSDPSYFSIQGSEVRFSLTSIFGTVDFWGTVQGNGLALNSHSRINDYRTARFFRFIAVA